MGISFKVFIYYVLCVWITMIAGANISIAHKTKLYIEETQIFKKKKKVQNNCKIMKIYTRVTQIGGVCGQSR